MYKYIDEKGTLHVTDSYEHIPVKYRSQVEEIKVESHTYGYTPSVGEAIGSEEYGSNAWFDYGDMPFYERWFLLVRENYLHYAPWAGILLFLASAIFILSRVLR